MQHLYIFCKKLLIQWEALNYTLVTCVEGPQLHPLASRISGG